MNVNPSRRSTFVIIGAIGVVVFISLAVWNFAQQEPEVSAELAAQGASAADPAAEADVSAETPEVAADDAERMSPAKRIVHVPDTRPTPAGPDQEAFETVTGANVAELAARSAQMALDGNLESARDLIEMLTLCSGLLPRDEGAFERELERATEAAAQAAAEGTPIPPEGAPFTSQRIGAAPVEIRIYPTRAQNLAHLTEWREGCSKVNGLFNEQMREELAELARNGHVTARYLYAMWRPRLTANKGALERRMQWQMNAIDFSYANLEAGEVAGLIAFSHSYVEAMFTGLDIGLAVVMARAALECGDESEQIRKTVERFGNVPDYEMSQRIVGLSPDEFNELVAEYSSRCR